MFKFTSRSLSQVSRSPAMTHFCKRNEIAFATSMMQQAGDFEFLRQWMSPSDEVDTANPSTYCVIKSHSSPQALEKQQKMHLENVTLRSLLREKTQEEEKLAAELEDLKRKFDMVEMKFQHAKEVAFNAMMEAEEATMFNIEQISRSEDGSINLESILSKRS